MAAYIILPLLRHKLGTIRLDRLLHGMTIAFRAAMEVFKKARQDEEREEEDDA